MIAGYLDRDSRLHRLPAGVKLAALALLSVLVLPVSDPRVLGGLLLALLLVYAGFGRVGLARLRRWAAILPLLAFIAALQVWATSWEAALASVLRILAMVLLADLVTLSTRLQDMMDVFARLLAPLGRLGLDVPRLALAVALVLRFVPVLFASWQGRAEAWRARCPRRPGLALVGAFFAGALRSADQVAEALDARGFAGGAVGRGAAARSLARRDSIPTDLVQRHMAQSDLARSELAQSHLAQSHLADSHLARNHLAQSQMAKSDLAHSDLAQGDLARGNLARGDLAQSDLTESELAQGDLAESGPARKDRPQRDQAHTSFATMDVAEAGAAGQDVAAVRTGKPNGVS